MYVCVVLLIIAELRLIVADLDGKQSWIGTKGKRASAWLFTLQTECDGFFIGKFSITRQRINYSTFWWLPLTVDILF